MRHADTLNNNGLEPMVLTLSIRARKMKSSLRFFSSDCGPVEGAPVSISADQRGEIPLMIGEVCLLRRDLLASIGRNPQSSRRLAKMMCRIEIDSLPGKLQ